MALFVVATFDEGFVNLKIEPFNTAVKAKKAIKGRPKALLIGKGDDLRHLTPEQLTMLHEAIHGPSPVRFRDVESGADRCCAAIMGLTRQAIQSKAGPKTDDVDLIVQTSRKRLTNDLEEPVLKSERKERKDKGVKRGKRGPYGPRKKKRRG